MYGKNEVFAAISCAYRFMFLLRKILASSI